MPFTVLSPGLLTLPVAAARPGRRALGIPPGGPADEASFALGNALVGNAPDAPAAEIALLGPTLLATTDTGCVVSGAPFEITRDGEPVPPNHTFTVRAGQVLRIAGTPTGCRAYLCVPGGFALPPVPVPLAVGDELSCPESRVRGRTVEWQRGGRLWAESQAGTPLPLRVLPGPQRDWFPDDALFTRPWVVGEASNRMGVRLVGQPIPKRTGEMVSEPVSTGAVQVTHDGRPILLGVDGQTIGGYPKVAHVIRADLDQLGRLRPGAVVRFEPVSFETAEVVNRERRAELRGWLARLAVAEGVVVQKS